MRLKSEKGYSLAEILVVMALAATIVVIGAPALIKEMSHIRLKRSAMDISTELSAARMKAITNNTKYRVEFTLNAAPTVDTFRLALWNIGTSAWEADPRHAVKDVESGINIAAPAASFNIEFFTNGESVDQEVCLQNTATDRMKVKVERWTGKITVETGC